MSRTTQMYLLFDYWPADDQTRWKAAFKTGDLFDESGLGAHLAESTRKMRRESYGRFLEFISARHPDLLSSRAHERVNRTILPEYADWRRRSCGEFSLSIDLDQLRGASKLICPGVDWSWLLTITKRIAAAAPRSRPKYHLITSERLYALGLQLMDGAVADEHAAGQMTQAHARSRIHGAESHTSPWARGGGLRPRHFAPSPAPRSAPRAAQ